MPSMLQEALRFIRAEREDQDQQSRQGIEVSRSSSVWAGLGRVRPRLLLAKCHYSAGNKNASKALRNDWLPAGNRAMCL